MAGVFRNEQKWGTYQDEQLRVLKNIQDAFKDSLKIATNVSNSMNHTERSLGSLAIAVGAIAKDLGSLSEDEFRKVREAATQLDSASQQASESLEGFGAALNQNAQQQDAHVRVWAEAQRRREVVINDLTNTFKKAIKDIANTVAEHAKKISTVTNSLIAFTENDYKSVEEYRNKLFDEIIPELNKDTGNAYSADEAFQRMTSIASSADIGSLDTLEAITRPILLADKAMNVNLTDLASLLGRWYTRYGFSSMSMEGMLDNIRQNTAGNQASAQKALEAVTQLEPYLVDATQGDEQKLVELTDIITQEISRLESMGIDSTRFIETIQSVLSGEVDSSLSALIGRAGYNLGELQSGLTSGDKEYWIGIFERLLQTEHSLAEELKNVDAYARDDYAHKYGREWTDLLDSHNVVEYGKYVSREGYLESSSDQTAAGGVEDQHYSLLEKIGNHLSSYLDQFAAFQESIGIDIGEILSGVTSVMTAGAAVKFLLQGSTAGGGNILASLATGLATSLGSGGALATALGSGSVLLTALGPLAAVAGIGLAVAGIYEVTDRYGKKLTEEIFNDEVIKAIIGNPEDTVAVIDKITTPGEGTRYEEAYVSKEEYERNKDFFEQNKLEFASSEADRSSMTFGEKVVDGVTSPFISGAGGTISQEYRDVRDSVISNVESGNALGAVLVNYGEEFQKIIQELHGLYTEAGLITSGAEESEFADKVLSVLTAYVAGTVYDFDGDLSTLDKQYDMREFPAFRGDPVVTAEEAIALLRNTGNSTPAYAEGSNYISSSQMAYLHEGEAVVPKRYNPEANKTELEMLRQHYKRDLENETRITNEQLRATVASILEIKEFLVQWKDDNLKRSISSEALGKFSYAQAHIAAYQR